MTYLGSADKMSTIALRRSCLSDCPSNSLSARPLSALGVSSTWRSSPGLLIQEGTRTLDVEEEEEEGASYAGMYGLMSRIGVPSRRSRPLN